MAYTDPQFNVSTQESLVGSPNSGVSLGTVTASATQTYTGTAGTGANGIFRLPVFKSPAKVNGIRVYCQGAAGNGVTGINLGFYNGTSVFGSGAAPAVNTYADMTMVALTTASNGALTGAALFTNTNVEPTMINTATGTGSGSALGSYSVDFIWQNLFTT